MDIEGVVPKSKMVIKRGALKPMMVMRGAFVFDTHIGCAPFFAWELDDHENGVRMCNHKHTTCDKPYL